MTTRLVFGIAIGLGAGLLFQVQFLLARLILPWFGGAPAVWSTSLVVFQALLLGGYAYAHATAGLPSRRAQLLRHAGLVALVLAVLAWRAAAWPSPVTPGEAWKPALDAAPVPRIVWLLVSAAGLPFLLLATTSPLLQRWYADWTSSRGEQGSAYRLYAVSNLGSLVGLVSYPLVVEPQLDLFEQGWWWSAAFAADALAVLACALGMRRVPIAGHAAPVSISSHVAQAASAPTAGDYAIWLALAAVPAMLLQASTTRLTIDVAAVPFLWMLPLATYLLTFILAFEYRRLYRRRVMTMLVVLAPLAAIPEWNAGLTVALTLLALGAIGVAMHGELAARAPAPAHLTRYYLLVSAGGVAGSALVAFGAPLAFSSVHEYPLSFLAALATFAAVHAMAARAPGGADTTDGLRLIAGALALLAALVGLHTAMVWRRSNDTALHASRNFFGAIRVSDRSLPSGSRYRRFDHGTTMHGAQFLDAARARMPAAYFTRGSGIGQAMTLLDRTDRPRRIGVLGQGAGTMAAYGRSGDVVTFFEIDPDVIALSAGVEPFFTYVRDSAATVAIVAGDGRLALERAAPYGFDLLAMDAFSSDAVPAHLLTREAMAVYVRHLRDDHSLLVVNVTNRYLDLHDVVAAAGRTVGLEAVRVDHQAAGELVEGTSFMVLSRDRASLGAIGPRYEGREVRPWTDAFSNLLGVIRW